MGSGLSWGGDASPVCIKMSVFRLVTCTHTLTHSRPAPQCPAVAVGFLWSLLGCGEPPLPPRTTSRPSFAADRRETTSLPGRWARRRGAAAGTHQSLRVLRLESDAGVSSTAGVRAAVCNQCEEGIGAK